MMQARQPIAWVHLQQLILVIISRQQLREDKLVINQTCPTDVVVAKWCNGQGVGSRHERSRVRLPAVPLSGNNPGQVVHTRVPLSPSSIIWYRSGGGDALQLGR